MGIRSTLAMLRGQAEITAAIGSATTDPSTFPIASPWSSSTLERIVAEDVFGTDLPVNTRAAAMRIPAVFRARNLVCSTIGRLPLGAATAAGPLDRNPSWMMSAPDGLSPQLRIVWTVDDLIHYGWSCWWRDNGADGFPLTVQRINQGSWRINGDNRVEINGVVVDDRNVILIPGIHEGILSAGRDVLEDARALYRNVRARLATPTPGLDLHQTGGRELSDAEIDTMIERWAVARRGLNGGVSFTSRDIEAKPMTGDDGQLMIEARNAASLDLARLVGVSAGRIDATSPKASLNYETTTGRNQEFVDFDLALYMTPITARLSLDDVLPHGQHAFFNLADFVDQAPSVSGPTLED